MQVLLFEEEIQLTIPRPPRLGNIEIDLNLIAEALGLETNNPKTARFCVGQFAAQCWWTLVIFKQYSPSERLHKTLDAHYFEDNIKDSCLVVTFNRQELENLITSYETFLNQHKVSSTFWGIF